MRAAVQLHVAPRDGEAQAGAGGLGREVGLEDPRQRRRRPCRRRCRRRRPRPARRPRRGASPRSVPSPGIACSAFSITLVSARASSTRSTMRRGQPGRRRRWRSRCGRPGPCAYGGRISSSSGASGVGSGRACGDVAKLENSDASWRSSRTCSRMLVDAFVDQRAERPAAVGVHAAQVFGVELDRRQRVLDVVRHLPGHLGPGLEAVGALELRRAGAAGRRPCR